MFLLFTPVYLLLFVFADLEVVMCDSLLVSVQHTEASLCTHQITVQLTLALGPHHPCPRLPRLPDLLVQISITLILGRI